MGDAATELLFVDVSGPPIKKMNGQPVDEMPFLDTAPAQPSFLEDIGETEWERRGNKVTRTLVFDSKKPIFDASGPSMAQQHTINGIQFADGHAELNVLLDTVEEWIVKNTTTKENGPPNSRIDHPLHIHVNPFQVTEVFDPNEVLKDRDTGEPATVLQNGFKVPVWRYYLTGEDPVDKARQCELDPNDRATWREGGKIPIKDGKVDENHPCRQKEKSNLVWWDVFAIPAARAAQDATGASIIIPGYFKMRSRFVDYPGLYVMHCHILIHEDRGMMFAVEVLRTKSAQVRHH